MQGQMTVTTKPALELQGNVQTKIKLESVTFINGLDKVLAEKISRIQKTVIVLHDGDKSFEIMTKQCNIRPPPDMRGTWNSTNVFCSKTVQTT